MIKRKFIFIIIGIASLFIILPPILALVFGVWPPNCEWVVYPPAIEMCKKAKSGETTEMPWNKYLKKFKESSEQQINISQPTQIPSEEIKELETIGEEKSAVVPSASSQLNEKSKFKQLLQLATNPYTITFTVKVPENTPIYTIVYLDIGEGMNAQGRNFKMEKGVGNIWNFKTDLRDFKNQEISYKYLRNNWGFVGAEEFSPDSKTASRKVLVAEKPKEINDVVEKWRWLPKGEFVMPIIPTDAGKIAFASRADNEKYQKGAMFVDFWWGNFFDLLNSTHARLKEKGFQWIEVAPPWDYKQINPVPIITSEGFGHTYSNDELDFHLNKMKADGFKVYMAPQVCCADTSKASFSKEWWDAWFSEYEKYAMYFVNKANKYNVEYLIITGDWVVVGASPDKRPADYKEKLEAIYGKAKSAYKGKLGRGFFIGGEIGSNIPDIWPNIDSMPFMEQADFIGINWWVGLTDKNNPTQEELNANVKRIFDLRLKPLYEKYKKPIILQQVAYPSIDGGLTGKAGVDDAATALWEPYSDKYKLDLEEQAMGFEAIMKNVVETSYIIGIYPFTYWPDDFPLTKEYNVRGKPTEEILSQWYKSIP